MLGVTDRLIRVGIFMFISFLNTRPWSCVRHLAVSFAVSRLSISSCYVRFCRASSLFFALYVRAVLLRNRCILFRSG